MKSDLKYLYIDGDNIGLRIEISFLDDNEQLLIEVNQSVKEIVSKTTDYLVKLNQEIIFSGADGIISKGISINYVELLNTIREINNSFTFSIGVGRSLKDSYIALRYAKAMGKNVVVCFEENEFMVMRS